MSQSSVSPRGAGPVAGLVGWLVLSLAFASAAGCGSEQASSTDPSVDAGARLMPLPESEWSPEVMRLLRGTRGRVAALEGEAASGPASSEKTLAILRTLAHHPRLMGPFLGFATALAQQGALSRRDSELLALRAAWNCQSEFEWGHHVLYARAAGLTEEEVDRIAQGPRASGWSDADRTLLEAADQLHLRQQIDDEVWTRLEARFAADQLVEIPFVIGQYTMLSMVASMTGVALEEGYPGLPESGRKAGD